MMQKLEVLVQVAIEALVEVRTYYSILNGNVLPIETAPAPQPLVEKKPRAPRKAKVEAQPEVVEQPSPFAQETAAAAGKPEDAAESKRRCQEVMGLFIRRYLKSVPPGLDRAKAVLAEVCKRPISKLEDLTHEDHVKLIPRFEAELEKAEAK